MHTPAVHLFRSAGTHISALRCTNDCAAHNRAHNWSELIADHPLSNPCSHDSRAYDLSHRDPHVRSVFTVAHTVTHAPGAVARADARANASADNACA